MESFRFLVYDGRNMPIVSDIPQWVPQKVCLTCDGCCRFKDEQSPWRPKVAKSEYASPGIVEKIFSAQHVGQDHFLKAVQETNVCRCTFFDLPSKTCSIYPQRPFECRLYPFLLTRSEKGDGAAIYVHLACPHIQETHLTPGFREFVQQLKDYFHQKNVKAFIQANKNVLVSDYSAYADEIAFLFDIPL
jgi:Fe-S-cluster containining protein